MFNSKTVFEWKELSVNEDMNIEEFFKDIVARTIGEKLCSIF